MHTVSAVRFACMGVLSGCALASIFFDTPNPLYIIVAASLGATVLFIGVWYPRAWLVAIIACMVSFSWALVRHTSYSDRVAQADGARVKNAIVRYVDLYPSRQRLTVRISEEFQEPLSVYIYTRRYPVYRVGDVLSFDCRLQAVERGEDVRFDRFAERHAITHICTYPRLQVVGHKDSLRSYIFAIKERARLTLVAGFHEPTSSLLQALILGSANEISQDIWNAFATSGLVHILSVSGFHVSVLFMVVTQLAIACGLGVRAQAVVGGLFLIGYLILLGAPAAAVRAALLGSSVVAARLFGRPASGTHILFVSAAGMTLINPLIVVWDVGFQLSFLAMLGIALWQEKISRAASLLPNIADVRSAVSMGAAAYLCLAPALLLRYGSLSLVGIIATAAFGPLFSWLLVGTIIFAALGNIPLIAAVLRLPLYALGSYLIEVARVSASVPFVSITVPEAAHFNTPFGPLNVRFLIALPWFAAIAFFALKNKRPAVTHRHAPAK